MSELTPQQLTKILEGHRRWLESAPEVSHVGRRAELRGVDLSGVDLSSTRLCDADLRGANLREADLSDADLCRADLRGADLSGAKLERSDLACALLAHTKLEHADLAQSRHLTEGQLRGCNLFHARIPADMDFTGVSSAEQLRSHLRPQLASFVMICLYSWLTISSTTDLDLLTNARSVSFPFIDVSLPIVGLYLVAPVLVLASYVSLYLHLLMFWERLSLLPAVFPNGDDLSHRIDVSILNSILHRHLPRLGERHPPTFVDHLKIVMVHLGLDGLALATLVAFWVRHLPRHDWYGTVLHIMLMLVGTSLAWLFPALMNSKLEREAGERERRSWLLLPLSATLTILVLSVWVFERGRIPELRLAYADVSYADLGQGSDNARAVVLTGMNLRFANLEGLLAMQANFDAVALEGANLHAADLRGANFRAADLSRANLEAAQLEDAQLPVARLTHAQLERANLSRANLSRAVLSHARMLGAQLDGGNYTRAQLDDTNLNGCSAVGADFTLARLERVRLAMSKLRDANLFLAKLREGHLWKADLSGASMVLADAYGANLSFAILDGADASQAKFDNATLSFASLNHATLVHSSLCNAKLDGTDLDGADLGGALLRNTDLHGAELANTDFSGAWLEGTRLEGVDLRYTRGLTQEQLDMACIDADTLLPEDLLAPPPNPSCPGATP